MNNGQVPRYSAEDGSPWHYPQPWHETVVDYIICIPVAMVAWTLDFLWGEGRTARRVRRGG